MGGLHVVFTVLKVWGKNINNSGLDLSFEEAGIYGPATSCQTKEEKYLYRYLEASAFCSISHIISEIHHENVRETLRPSSTLKEVIDTCTITMNENSTLEIKDKILRPKSNQFYYQ